MKTLDDVRMIEGSHTELASFYSGLCQLRLGHPRSAIIYLTEATGLTKHLDEGSLKLLRRVNLIYTGRFLKLKKELEEDEYSGPVIGPTQWKIIILVVLFFSLILYGAIFIVFLPLFAYRDLISRDCSRKKKTTWKILIIALPYLGAIFYYLFRRR